MIGLVFVTHGGLATEFQLALEHVVGPQEALETISIGPDDDMEQRRVEILEAVGRVRGQGTKGAGEGGTEDAVIILTDMFGGTPSNLAISVMEPGQIEVMAGMNLPMLIKLAGLRAEADLDTVLAKSMEAGKRYINVASQVLAGQS